MSCADPRECLELSPSKPGLDLGQYERQEAIGDLGDEGLELHRGEGSGLLRDNLREFCIRAGVVADHAFAGCAFEDAVQHHVVPHDAPRQDIRDGEISKERREVPITQAVARLLLTP